jgi:hypothetical protein
MLIRRLWGQVGVEDRVSGDHSRGSRFVIVCLLPAEADSLMAVPGGNSICPCQTYSGRIFKRSRAIVEQISPDPCRPEDAIYEKKARDFL